jgi:NAD binding domain of 6-phosphogluconate dehydrogenase
VGVGAAQGYIGGVLAYFAGCPTVDRSVKAVMDVYFADQGLLSSAAAGTLLIETSTLKPDTVAILAARCQAKGLRFVECPVMGTAKPARRGQLVAACSSFAAAAGLAPETLIGILTESPAAAPVLVLKGDIFRGRERTWVRRCLTILPTSFRAPMPTRTRE